MGTNKQQFRNNRKSPLPKFLSNQKKDQKKGGGYTSNKTSQHKSINS